MRRTRVALLIALALAVALLLVLGLGDGPAAHRAATERAAAKGDAPAGRGLPGAHGERGEGSRAEDGDEGGERDEREADATEPVEVHTVRGRIVDEDGTARSDVRLYAVRRDRLTEILRAERILRGGLDDLPFGDSGEDGRFAFRGLAPGDYRIVPVGDALELRGDVDFRADADGLLVIAVPACRVEFDLRDLVTEKLIHGASVVILPPFGDGSTAFPVAGRFSRKLLVPKSARHSVPAAPGVSLRLSAPGYYDARIARPQEARGNLWMLPRGVGVSNCTLTVRYEDGTPVRGKCRVTLTRGSRTQGVSLEEQGPGRFEFGLAPGSWRLSHFKWAAGSRSFEFEIAAGGRWSEEIVLPRCGTAAVRRMSWDGGPWMLVLHHENASAYFQVSEAGREIPDLVPGTYSVCTLTHEKDGSGFEYGPRQEFEVVADRVTEVELP